MMLRLIQQRLDPRLHEAPRPSVQRLLLTPHDGLRVRVLIEVVAQLCPWKGVELFDARDGGVFLAFGFAVLDEGGVHLAGAHNHAFDLVVGFDVAGLVRRIGNDPLEVGVPGHVFDAGAGERMAKEGFGEEDNQGYEGVSDGIKQLSSETYVS